VWDEGIVGGNHTVESKKLMFMHMYWSRVGVVLLILNILAVGFFEALLRDYKWIVNIQEEQALNCVAPEINIHCNVKK